jgi:hypothetical protein
MWEGVGCMEHDLHSIPTIFLRGVVRMHMDNLPQFVRFSSSHGGEYEDVCCPDDGGSKHL